ncbi:phage head closure protein [Mannheimia granulomatis]|uniref:phage head closure protein n=1 Tax=Mannheimia granulomatis TaxID=85402 RepID=UPI000479887F|nr:phage head closure protein [Mannheimia granulomatis]QLB18668.1 head-tail adaptor protein [Mannheimia granulomatis]
MNIGKLRHCIIIQTQRHRPSGYGAVVLEWGDLHTIWAEVKPISGRELISASQIHAEATAQIWLRYLPNLDHTMRVKFGDRLFEIVAIQNWRELNRSLLLHCKELTNGDT